MRGDQGVCVRCERGGKGGTERCSLLERTVTATGAAPTLPLPPPPTGTPRPHRRRCPLRGGDGGGGIAPLGQPPLLNLSAASGSQLPLERRRLWPDRGGQTSRAGVFTPTGTDPSSPATETGVL